MIGEHPELWLELILADQFHFLKSGNRPVEVFFLVQFRHVNVVLLLLNTQSCLLPPSLTFPTLPACCNTVVGCAAAGISL